MRILTLGLLPLNIAACGPWSGSHSSKNLPAEAPTSGWRVMTSKLFEFSYPDPESEGPTSVAYDQDAHGFWLGLDGGGAHAGLNGEEVHLFGFGAEFTDEASCAKFAADADATKVHDDPTILNKDESKAFAPANNSGKYSVFQRFYVIAGPSACLNMLFYDATFAGYDSPVSFADQTDAGNFLRTFAGSFRPRR